MPIIRVHSNFPARSRGAALVGIVVMLSVATVLVLTTVLLSTTEFRASRTTRTTSTLTSLEEALIQFVSLHGRLPCPANGSLDTGKADPDTANPICNSLNGTVPWAELGISQDAALDGWGRRVSYRVFAGNTGLTQSDGASMVNCDSQKPGGAAQLLANGLCASDYSNLSSQFLKNKGLTVNNSGTNEGGIAFVLISHGETGYGAWLPGGNRMQLPDAGNASETANTGSGGTYYSKSFSAPDILPSDANHFDDMVKWLRIEDLIRRSGRIARDWPEDEPEFTAATTTNMTTTSTDRFNLATSRAGSVAATTTGGVTTLEFAPAGADAYYSNCIWWPQSLITYNGSDWFSLDAYLEFSTADGSRSNNDFDDLGGMVIGFLPWHAQTDWYNPNEYPTMSTALCGRKDVSTYLGWENDSWQGNLPKPRFGVEYDAFRHPQTNDPTPGHLSLVDSGVTHGTSASNCSGVSDSYFGTTCYTGTGTSWLRNGLNNFHKIRVAVKPNVAACSNAPEVSVFLLPYDVCSDSANAAICSAIQQLNTSFEPASLPTGAVQLKGCVPAPTMSDPYPSDAFDRVFFGFTLANRFAGYSGSGMRLRNLSINSRLID